jgi:hypothetical protein
MMRTLLLALALLCCAGPAAAHKPSDSYLTLKVDGQHIDGQWDISLRDLDFAIGIDSNGDGQLSWDEIRARHPDIAAYALSRLMLSTEQQSCTTTAGEQLIDHHTDGAYTVLRFEAVCPVPINKLSIWYRLFADTDAQHKGLLQLVHAGRSSTAIFGLGQDDQTLVVAEPRRLQQFVDYARHGVWHIWIGFDHILFLVSLLLPAVLVWQRRSWQPVPDLRSAAIDALKIVSAFTLAHSVTLSLAALGLVSMPSRWVESAIAASVVVAALNNVLPLMQHRRWLAAFAFGLVHGFGFASVLADLGLPPEALLSSLLGFNLGVELGQLAIVALLLPLAYAMRASWVYRRVVVAGGSVVIMLVASTWLVERAFDLPLITASAAPRQ